MNEIEIDVSLASEDERTTIRRDLEEQGAEDIQQPREGGMTGIEFAILALVSVQALVFIVTKLSRLWSCGVTIDARGRKVKTVKDPNLPEGHFVTIAHEGTKVEIHEPSPANLTGAIQALVGK